MARNNCKSIENEQLFTLEVFVNDVTLYVDKLQKKELNDLGIDLKFIDFPIIRILQNEYELTKIEKSKEIRSNGKCHIVNFNCGQTHLFPRIPSELVNAMRSSKLILDVYKIKGISICPYQILKDPLGEAEIPLHGCLCDQVTMATNDINYMPRPYIIKNKFILLNEEHMMSGMIALFLRLQCIGKHSTVEFANDEKTLLFKNKNFPDEFRCMRVPIYDEILIRAQEKEKKICFLDEKLEPNEIDLPPDSKLVINLTQICTMLTERDGLPKDLFSSLKTKFTNNKYKLINDKEKEYNRWPSKTFIIDTSISDIHIRSHLGNKPCYTVGCSGGLCSGGKSMWGNMKYL